MRLLVGRGEMGGGKLILVMSKTTSWDVESEWKIESGKWKII